MTKPLTFRPSSIQRVLGCPGSAQAEAPYPFEPGNKYTERGKRLHDGMALVFRIGLTPAIEKLRATWQKLYDENAEGCLHSVDQDIQNVVDAHTAGKLIIPKDGKLAVEYALDLSKWGLSGGRPDLMVNSDQTKTGLVIDWKFGSGQVEDPSANGQLWAYGFALSVLKPELQALELAIVQPGAWKTDQAFRTHTFTKPEINNKMQIITNAISLAKTETPPLMAGDHCTYCKARNDCATYAAMKTGAALVKAEAKAEAKAVQVEVVSGGTPIEVKFEPVLPGAVVVVSKELMAKADSFLAIVNGIKVTDEATANAAGQVAKNIRALMKDVDEQRTAIKAPFLEACRRIDDAPKAAVALLAQANNVAQDAVSAWMRDEQERARLARIEQERKDREAAAAVAAAAEAERLAQEKLELAQKAAQVPQEALELPLDGTAPLTAPPGLHALAEAQKAVEQSRVANQTANAAVTAAAVAAAVPVGASKVAGFKPKEEVTYEIPDLSKVPAEWARQILMPDDKVIKVMLASTKDRAAKLTEANTAGWMVITRKLVAGASR